MIRNANYVMERLIDSQHLAKPAQVGVDLTVNKILEISKSNAGEVYIKGTKLGLQTELEPDANIYTLEGGHAYAVEFDQGISLAENETGFIIQRSSLNRNGCMLVGSVFDPGFHTEVLGATLYASCSIRIEKHARIAQLLIAENNPVENKYSGQFQGKVGS